MAKTIFDFDKNMQQQGGGDRPLVWRNAKENCFARYGSDALFEEGWHRLTAAQRARIRAFNDGEAWCAEHSSGILLKFETDSADIRVRVKLDGKFNMTNMTEIGQCGLDLYVYDGRVGGYALHEVARYDLEASYYEVPLSHFVHAPREMRRYILNLPLYIAVEELEIGLEEGAAVRPVRHTCPARIAVYGTSIVHGCSASRPGLAPTNILSRRLDAEVYNFGFSGSAMMEPEVGDIIGAHAPDALIVDTEPNAGVDERLRDNAAPFLDAFFARTETPVVLFSRVPFALDLYDGYRARMADYYRAFLRGLAAKYRRRGHLVTFADGFKLFKGNFTEYTCDGIHPDDVGMFALADAYERELRRLGRLKKS